jgi:DNA-binding response OmpR family regulator/signal transduction histidine kinase
MRILVVEDEVKMAGLLHRGLTEDGHVVDVAASGDDAVWMGQVVEYDAIVLDLMLPGVDGVQVCRRWRENGVWSPALMLTARDAVDDRVAGLDAGADDYLAKPFSFAELLARLRALARRGAAERPVGLEVGELRLDPATRQVWRGEVEIALSGKEFALLETFMRRPGDVLSRVYLLEHAWDYALQGLAELVRIAARTVSTPAGDRVLVVGSSLDDRDETVRRFVLVLLLVAPVALVLTSLLGYGIATAALRPVDAMRVEAEAISAAEPERRLPLSPAHDEIRRLGVTLNEMLERLGDALERERRFVADASHELRTPLALLETELELALRQPRSHAELEGAVRSAAEETDRLVRLAEDLLVVASADRGTLAIRRTPEAAAALMEEVAERFRKRARSERRRVEAGAPAGLELEADGVRIRQALGNLVDNALRHGSGTVGVHAEQHDGRIELHVTDEGDGFASTFLPRAFERFSRDDEARASGGAGLGLSIVEAIARAHGGSVGASNRPTGGADVWLTLPMQPEPSK